MGAERMGIDVKFLTGIYYKPNRFPYFLARWAPAKKRQALLELLELRRIEGLSPDNVVTILGPVPEVAYKLRLISLRTWWNTWDWLAAKWIQLRCARASTDRSTLIHCFMECSRRTLKAAAGKGMIRLLEVTLPPLLVDRDTMQKWGVSQFDFPDVSSLKLELAEADFVLVQSEFGARTISMMGFPPSRILRIHLGLDADKFRPRVGPRKPGPLRVIFSGQISRRKGVHHLIQAWNDLQLENAELLLAGNTNNASPELLEAVKRTPNCKAVGHLRGQDLLAFYQQADILVHPSLAEGGCAAIYEGLGCGLPCIISDHSSSAVRSGIEGIVFPVGDIAALKLAILALYSNAPSRQQMAIAARQRAEQALSFAAFSREVAEIYRTVAETAASGKCDGVPDGRFANAF